MARARHHDCADEPGRALAAAIVEHLRREAFSVDSNCHRVLSRVGLLSPEIHVKAGHDFLQLLIPKHLRRSLHVNLVHPGRTICVPGTPRCDICPIVDLCATGRRSCAAGMYE